MREIFKVWNTENLQGHLVWIPMLPTDVLDAAVAQEALFQDDRVMQYWDGERALGRLVSQTLALSEPIAWDIYLLYSYNAKWLSKAMPKPDYWMHQLNERPDLLLNKDKLMAEIKKAIDGKSIGEFLNE